MIIEEGFVTYLTNHPALSALISGRIYPSGRVPDKATLPAVVYQRISAARVYSHSGASGLANPRFQYDCLAATYDGAVAVGNVLIGACSGFHGSMGQVRVDAAFVDNDMDDYEPDSKIYTRRVDVRFWHAE